MSAKNNKSTKVSAKNIVEALMEGIVDGIIIIDAKGTIQTANPATQQIFGYTSQELIGQNVKMLMPESYARAHDNYLSNYLNTGIKKIIGTTSEVTGLRKSGDIFPLELTISEVEVNGKLTFAGIVRDISPRKRVEQELFHTNKRLSLATEAGGIGVWEYNVATGDLVWDDRMFSMYGISRDHFSGAYDAWQHALHPDDIESAEHSLNLAIENGTSFDAEFRIKWPSGERRYIQAHARAILDDSNQTQHMIGVNIDITASKLAAKESQARENRIRALINTIVDGIIVINNKGDMLSLNPAAEKLFGYSQDELKFKNIKMLMPEPYQSAHDGYLKNYQQTGHKKIIGIGREVVGKRKDGSTFPMELAVSEAEVAGEQLFTGIVRDISERNTVMDQLRLQSGALEAAANAILITDCKGTIQSANSAFTRLSGYLPEEVIGHTPRILKSSKHSAQFFQELWQTINRGDVWHGEVINKRKDGSLYTEEQTITPLTDEQGRITHFIAIKSDISERKAVEANIAEKTRALEIVAEFERTQSKVMALFNASTDMPDVFKQILELLADSHQFPVSAVYLFDEWLGRLKCTASYGLPDNFSRIIEIGSGVVGQSAQSGHQSVIKSGHDMPFKIDTGLFAINPAMVIATPITFSSKVLGVLVLASVHELNKTELSFLEKLAEQIGIALNNQNQYQHLKALSEQLQQRGKEITQKNALLEQSNRLKTEFLANMSHELRTPLNAIIGFSEVLKDQLLGDLNDEQSDYTQEIYDSAQHLLSLINDILDLSKIEAGKMQLYLETVNLPEMLNNSLSIIKEKAHNHNIDLQLEVADGVEYFQVDTRKFKQILYNLLSNAVKFTEEGGSVRLIAEKINGDMSIKVSDTGIGISESEIELLFQPFVQLDGSLSRHYEGTGLGLAMVKRLVELHHGSVKVTSEKGKGSCFECIFPYKDSKIENEQVIVQQTEEATEMSSKILIVENDSDTRTLIKSQLEQLGHQIFLAKNQLEAYQMAIDTQPQLIVLDVMLPEVDDIGFMHRLKANEMTKNIPVISFAAEAGKCVQLGSIDLLEKPVYKQSLLESVTHYLNQREPESYKILVVDDDVKAVRFLSEQLEAAGFQPIVAYGGQQAIQAAVDEQPDLIILDLMMPEVNGFEVIAQLNEHQNTKDIPVIILSAKILDEEDKQKLSKSVHNIIDKRGFETSSLLSLVQDKLVTQVEKKKLEAEPKLLTSTEHESPLILVVEDDQIQSELLKLYLLDAGYRVRVAANGSQGLEAMQQERPDLITLDLLMPEMGGTKFLEKKQQMKAYRSIPVMILSSTSSDEIDEAIAAEAVLTKPVQRAEMLRLVNNLLHDEEKERGSQKKLLVIDDDPKAHKIIASYLDDRRFQIIGALGGADGIDLAMSEQPDLILLDLMMPEMNGFEVLSVLKNQSQTNSIPIVILTAKLLSAEDREKLADKVALISTKGGANRESLTMQIDNIFNRYKQQ